MIATAVAATQVGRGLVRVAVVLDWLVWPPQHRISIGTARLFLIFPAAYTVYSLIRRSITGFHPYPFFNPAAVGGYGGVAVYCAALLVGFMIIALLIRWLGNVRRAPSAVPAT